MRDIRGVVMRKKKNKEGEEGKKEKKRKEKKRGGVGREKKRQGEFWGRRGERVSTMILNLCNCTF